MILQFVIVQPVLAIITFILEFLDLYDEGKFRADRGYVYLTAINNISITVTFGLLYNFEQISMYFLVLFYEATKDMLVIKFVLSLNSSQQPYRPIAKFLCIKSVIFFAFW
jgi:hypothetical protein